MKNLWLRMLLGLLLCLSGCAQAPEQAELPAEETEQAPGSEDSSASPERSGEEAPPEEAAGTLTLKTLYIFSSYTAGNQKGEVLVRVQYLPF